MKLAILLCLLSFTAYAKDYGNITVSEVTSIYDADTFRVNIEGYPPIAGERIPEARLKINPNSQRCVNCQSELEKKSPDDVSRKVKGELQ